MRSAGEGETATADEIIAYFRERLVATVASAVAGTSSNSSWSAAADHNRSTTSRTSARRTSTASGRPLDRVVEPVWRC
jgi:hypothetical protein